MTGTPLVLMWRRRRLAGWLTLARVLKSLRRRRLLTNRVQPNLARRAESRRTYSPKSWGNGASKRGRLEGGLEGECGFLMGEAAGRERVLLEEGSEEGVVEDKIVALLGVTLLVIVGNAPLDCALAILVPAIQAWKCWSHHALSG